MLHEWDEVSSTNDTAAALPAWQAVRANRQTSGRGRYRRAWASDGGGLWLSAVVPAGSPRQGWGALPLAAGLAVCEALQELGARPLRLRWPNDVLSGDRKLAGLLIDQFAPDRAVVGLGINVVNQPEAAQPDLAGAVARLADLIDPVPAMNDLAGRFLRRLRQVVGTMQEGGFAALLPRLDPWWPTGIRVEAEVEPEPTRVEGFFQGVDETGRLRIRTVDGETMELAAHQVLRMREKTGGIES